MDQNRVFVTKDGAGPERRRCFGLTHTTTAGCVRESGVCSESAGPFAKGGDSLVDTITEGPQDHSRMITTNEPRRFRWITTMRQRSATWRGTREAMKVAKPKFYKEIFSNAIIREGVDELTLREGEANTLRSFIIAANVPDGYIFTVGAPTPPSRGGVVPAKFPAKLVSMFTITGAFFGGMSCTQVDRYRAPPARLLFGGWRRLGCAQNHTLCRTRIPHCSGMLELLDV